MTLELWLALPPLLAGLGFFVAGSAALLRFPDLLTRLHGLTKADNLGLGLTVLGLLALSRSWGEALQLVLIWLLVMLSGAAVAQLIAAAALTGQDGTGEPGGAP